MMFDQSIEEPSGHVSSTCKFSSDYELNNSSLATIVDLSLPSSNALSEQGYLSLRRSNRAYNRSSYLKDFNCNITTHRSNLFAYDDLFY